MPLEFRDRTVVLTGADNLLGAALAEALADRRATLFSDAAGEAVEVLIDEALDRTGRVDVLVNCSLPDLADAGPEAFSATLDRYLTGPFSAMRKMLPLMDAAGYGRVLNIVPGAGAFGMEAGAAASAASAGLLAVTKCAALDVKAGDVCINALAPLANIPQMNSLFDQEPALDRGLFSIEDVLPAALYLVHETCTVSGDVYTAGAGRYSRILTSTAPGYFQPGLTAEEFAERLHEISDPHAAISPRSARGEFVLIAV